MKNRQIINNRKVSIARRTRRYQIKIDHENKHKDGLGLFHL